MKKKITALEIKVQKIEEENYKKEIKEKKNNIIIKEKLLGPKPVNDKKAMQRVKEIIKKITEKDEQIENAKIIPIKSKNIAIIRATVRTWRDKQKIMMKKRKLKGSNTFIENDLTKYEEEIQKNLKEIFRKEKEKGNAVKMGFQKIYF